MFSLPPQVVARTGQGGSDECGEEVEYAGEKSAPATEVEGLERGVELAFG